MLFLFLSYADDSPSLQAKIINQICDKHGFVYYKPPHNAGEIVIQYEKI